MSIKSNPSSFRFGQELEAEITQMAAAMDIPRSQLVKKAVRHFIARQKHIDAVLADARESYAAYTANGRGVFWHDAAKWMKSGGKKKAPVPKDMRQ